MVARLAKLVLALAGGCLLAGVAGFLLASCPRDWADLAEGVVWYGARLPRDWPLLLPIALVTLGLVLPLAGLTLQRRARFRRTRAERHRARELRVELLDLNRGLEQARRRLDHELIRARRDPDRALEALFAMLGEQEAGVTGLELGPDRSRMAVEVTATLRGRGTALPISSTTEALLQRVVDRLAGMLGGTRGQLRGELEYRSAARSELIRVETIEEQGGLHLRLRLVPDVTGPGRTRVTFMARPDRTPVPDRADASQPFSVDDSTDRQSGLLLGLDPSGEREVAPVVERRERRPVVGVEATLRLLAALAFAACVGLVVGSALEWGWRWARAGTSSAPWREVVVRIESIPPGARVTIDGRLRGQTPLAIREPCRERALSVEVGAAGHRTWSWRGICPAHGPLLLEPRLQPLP